MIQPKIQTVYLQTENYTVYTVKEDFGFDVIVDKKELITFTSEEFEDYKRELIEKFSKDYSEYCLKYGKSTVTTWLKLNTTNYFK